MFKRVQQHKGYSFLTAATRLRLSPHKILVCASALIFFAVNASAEPYLAQRYGQKCSACHTNMTGGGKRTDAGNAYAMGLTSTPATSGFSPKLNKYISVGGNFRGDWTYTRAPEAELQPGDPNPPQNIENTNSFNITNGLAYFEFALDDKLSFYLDQQVAPEGGRTREAVILYKGILGDDSYLKAGRFFLPFGLRLQDDGAFIRENTGFNFDNSDTGVELGFEPGPWSTSIAVTNGTQGRGENNRTKQVSFVGSYIQPKYRVGVSFADNEVPGEVTQTLYGIFAGVNVGSKLSLLAEYDIVQDEDPSRGVGNEEVTGELFFASANYLLSTSLNLKLSYDFFDPDDDIEENERTRASLLLEKFFNQYFQIRTGIRLNDGIPQNPLQNQDEFFTELHLFY